MLFNQSPIGNPAEGTGNYFSYLAYEDAQSRMERIEREQRHLPPEYKFNLNIKYQKYQNETQKD